MSINGKVKNMFAAANGIVNKIAEAEREFNDRQYTDPKEIEASYKKIQALREESPETPKEVRKVREDLISAYRDHNDLLKSKEQAEIDYLSHKIALKEEIMGILLKTESEILEEAGKSSDLEEIEALIKETTEELADSLGMNEYKKAMFERNHASLLRLHLSISGRFLIRQDSYEKERASLECENRENAHFA